MSGLQPGRSVILAPGGNNSAQIPLLMYARLAAQRRGASVRVIGWDLAGRPDIGQHGRSEGEQRREEEGENGVQPEIGENRLQRWASWIC